MLVFDLSNVGVGGGVAGRCANAESTCVCLCVCVRGVCELDPRHVCNLSSKAQE